MPASWACQPQRSPDDGVQAVLAFLDALDLSRLEALPCWPEILDSQPADDLSRPPRLALVCQGPAVIAAAGQATGQAGDATAGSTCLVTGEPAEIERLHSAIKGVWGAQTSGANIVSFNLDAFRSYGKGQGDNAPVGKPAAFAYTTALNHLLDRNSRQRIQVGDASTVFWAEQPNDLETLVPDLFGEPPKDDPDRGTGRTQGALQRRALRASSWSATRHDRFYVLGLAPNAARISVRFWHDRPRPNGPGDTYPAAFRRPADRPRTQDPGAPLALPPAGRLRRAGQGRQHPAQPGRRHDARHPRRTGPIRPPCSAPRSSAVAPSGNVTYPRAALIKAWLNRVASTRPSPTQRRSSCPCSTSSNPNPAYRLGRLFAALEKIQEEASPGLNATIRDRYYGAASSTPVAVFATLLRLKNHHLGKLAIAGARASRSRAPDRRDPGRP